MKYDCNRIKKQEGNNHKTKISNAKSKHLDHYLDRKDKSKKK